MRDTCIQVWFLIATEHNCPCYTDLHAIFERKAVLEISMVHVLLQCVLSVHKKML